MDSDSNIISSDESTLGGSDQVVTETAEEVITPKKFGTFQGVFTPTLLTILGVIMYVREGWVVGNAGLLGGMAVILLASAITFLTALSMSSITTNIRIKAGGAFSIISQSLGLEAGGAIGVPLYLAQAIAVAMYIFGFREGWLWLFPGHSSFLVDFVTFFLVFAIANISTDFAFKIQYIILAIIVGSLISVGLAFIDAPINRDFQLFGTYPGSPENNFSGTNFWIVFAVYFPAVTGIMAGANMSGDLENPRKSIPQGTLSAVILATIVYLAVAIALALLATPRELVENYNILIDKAFWPPIVLAGLLGATLSSAISSLVGAPRILFALGENNILVKNKILAQTDSKGEPKNALIITSLIVIAALLLRDLNSIAPLLTMFFLITYAMINVVVLIEQSLGQVSFRPTLRVPLLIPLLGTVGCFFAMFIINPTVSLVALALVVAAYILLMRKKFSTEDGDMRSGLFGALAEWSAKMVNTLPPAEERAWQPNMIVPAHRAVDVVRSSKILFSLANPKGSIKILGFPRATNRAVMLNRLEEIKDHFLEANISCTKAVVEAPDFMTAITSAFQAMQATFFRPNSVFLSLTDDQTEDPIYHELIHRAPQHSLGVYLYIPYGKVGLGLEKVINLWLDADDLKALDEMRLPYMNLAILTAYLLRRNWDALLNIHVIMEDHDEAEVSQQLERLMTLARIPNRTKRKFWTGGFTEAIAHGVRGDLNISYLISDDIDMARLRSRTNQIESSFLYTFDSGAENAFA